MVKIACSILALVVSSELFATELKPVLIYNQFPRMWDMNFEEMAKRLPDIASMGFNVVWVNPFFKTSDKVHVHRVDMGTGERITVSNSLYAMYDPALICSETVECSDGNPSGGGSEEANNSNQRMKNYTDEAKKNGIVPMFDLVINHVAKDSPLVSGSFSHFQNLHIHTDRWFKDVSDKWDDVRVFDYDTETNRSEIFEHLWRPLIVRIINDFGFDGVRIDYGTDVNQFVLKRCLDLIKELKKPVITFCEALIPADKPKRDILAGCRDTGFTNLTNLSVFLTEKQIFRGKMNYEWFLSDLGLKKLVSKEHSSEFMNGTIGFAGSHDHGTVLQAAVRGSISQRDIEEGSSHVKEIPSEISENDKLMEKIIKGKLTYERLTNMQEDEKLRWAKERIAIAAFSSDAGWYLMAGDELLSTVTKSPFVQAETKGDFSVNKDDFSLFGLSEPLPGFIKSVNDTFKKLHAADDIFWVEMFYLDEAKSGMCFVRHLSRDQEPVEVVVVNFLADRREIDIVEFARSFLSREHAELDENELNSGCVYSIGWKI